MSWMNPFRKTQSSGPGFLRRRIDGAKSVVSSIGRSAGQGSRRAKGYVRQEYGRRRDKTVRSMGYDTTKQNRRTETLKDISMIRKDLNNLRLNLRNTLRTNKDANKVKAYVKQIRTKLNYMNQRYNTTMRRNNANTPTMKRNNATLQPVVINQPNGTRALGAPINNNVKMKLNHVRRMGKTINYNPKTNTYVSEPLVSGQFQGLIQGIGNGEPPFTDYMNGRPYYLHVGTNGRAEFGRNKNTVPPEIIQRRSSNQPQP
jgi:hypothetical protein